MLLIRVIDTRNDGLVSRRLVHNQSYEELLHVGPLGTPSEGVEAQDDEFDDDDDTEADEDDDDDAEADEDEVADDEGADPVGSQDAAMGNLMTTGEKPSPQTAAQPEGANAVATSAHRLRRPSPPRGGSRSSNGGSMKKLSLSNVLVFLAAVLLCPSATSAQIQSDGQLRSAVRSTERANEQQPNVPAEARQVEDTVERAVRRFRLGVSGGVALDPELIDFGAHAAFGPLFNPNVEFRPGVEFGLGEVTTLFGINLDVLYTLPGATRQTRWMPYVGGGPNFALSHRGFESDTDDHGNRFDFSDTDFDGGFNFIAGARSQRGLFFEMKATAWGVSNVRLLAGFNF